MAYEWSEEQAAEIAQQRMECCLEMELAEHLSWTLENHGYEFRDANDYDDGRPHPDLRWQILKEGASVIVFSCHELSEVEEWLAVRGLTDD